MQSGEQIVEDVNVAKLKVKQLKLLKGSFNNLEKSNVQKDLRALGFKMGFYYIKHL